MKAQEEAAQAPTQLPTDGKSTTSPLQNAHSSLELHPDRQAMLEEEETTDASPTKNGPGFSQSRRVDAASAQPKDRTPRQSRYKREMEAGALRKAEMESRKQAREAREKDRRAMAKAKRQGRDGKVKLGRQGTVLLSRIQRLTAEGKI